MNSTVYKTDLVDHGHTKTNTFQRRLGCVDYGPFLVSSSHKKKNHCQQNRFFRHTKKNFLQFSEFWGMKIFFPSRFRQKWKMENFLHWNFPVGGRPGANQIPILFPNGTFWEISMRKRFCQSKRLPFVEIAISEASQPFSVKFGIFNSSLSLKQSSWGMLGTGNPSKSIN